LGDSLDAEFGNIVPGVFTPVLAKHTKSFNLVDTLSVGVDRIQRNFCAEAFPIKASDNSPRTPALRTW